ncbi:MAG: hypothetical protein ACRDO7_05000 [Nocardioidaceae bacterium]
MHRTTKPTRTIAGLVGLVASAVVATGTPATAYSPNPDIWTHHKYTSECPSSGCFYNDPYDDTYFKRDVGGRAVKLELIGSSRYLGKVEFHPYDEQLWIYDTRNDSDTFHVFIQVTYDGHETFYNGYKPPGTSRVVDKKVVDLSLREYSRVSISVYDNESYTDRITSTSAIA